MEERKMVIIVSDQIHFMYLIGYIPPPWFIVNSTNFQLPLLADMMQANHAPFMLRPFDELRIQHERGVAGFTPWRNGRSP